LVWNLLPDNSKRDTYEILNCDFAFLHSVQHVLATGDRFVLFPVFCLADPVAFSDPGFYHSRNFQDHWSHIAVSV
jgi:hypothetical protein